MKTTAKPNRSLNCSHWSVLPPTSCVQCQGIQRAISLLWPIDPLLDPFNHRNLEQLSASKSCWNKDGNNIMGILMNVKMLMSGPMEKPDCKESKVDYLFIFDWVVMKLIWKWDGLLKIPIIFWQKHSQYNHSEVFSQSMSTFEILVILTSVNYHMLTSRSVWGGDVLYLFVPDLEHIRK